MKERSGERLAMHVSGVTIFWNVLLSVFKLTAGILAGSGAMVSDAVHSASDVFSTVIVMIGVRMAGKEADREHPYGHERLECVAAILLSAALFLTGLMIGFSGVRKVVGENQQPLTAPGLLALAAAVVSIFVKEIMYRYTRSAARRIHSGALMADAWHHRSDALSSVGSFLGILGARLGYPILDPIAGIAICFFILKAAVGIFADAINKMTDHACDERTVEALTGRILDQDGVCGVDRISTRLFGDRAYVDVEIAVPGDLRLWEAHGIAEEVHGLVEREFPQVKHCMVHVNPAEETDEM